jgi:hypothetical protein
MADDLKISEMIEVTAGNLEDNMQMEVYDPNEAAVEDQNKRIRFDTLEGIFGAEDKIFEGDSSVEVVDTGTGEIIITVDAGEVGHYNASGLRLGGAGARVNDIETALTDDDTHLPTSGAVFDAIAGLAPDKIWEGDSSVEVKDVIGGLVEVTVDGTIEVTINSNGLALKAGTSVNDIETTLTNDFTHLPTSSAVVAALVADVKDIILEGDTSVEVIDVIGGSVVMKVDAVTEVTIDSNGLNLKSGASVNDIETSLTDDDTKLPTSGAVIDALAAEVKDIISEGNSKVEVIDTGTGEIQFEADATDIANLTAAIQRLGISTDTNITINQSANSIVAEVANNTRFDLDANRTIIGNGSQTRFRVDTDQNYLQGWIENNQAFECIGELAYWGDGATGIVARRTTQTVSVDINGTEKVLIAADGLALKGDQTGAEAIGNVATTVAVSFGTAHADANYQVICTVENTIDGGPLVLAAIITAKATTGFTATLSAATDSVNYVLNWLVVRS